MSQIKFIEFRLLHNATPILVNTCHIIAMHRASVSNNATVVQLSNASHSEDDILIESSYEINKNRLNDVLTSELS